MKIKITAILDVAELPEAARKELADGVNFRSEDDEDNVAELDDVPTVAEMDPSEVVLEITDALGGIFESYDTQAEIWAGTNFYGYISKVELVMAEQVTEG